MIAPDVDLRGARVLVANVLAEGNPAYGGTVGFMLSDPPVDAPLAPCGAVGLAVEQREESGFVLVSFAHPFTDEVTCAWARIEDVAKTKAPTTWPDCVDMMTVVGEGDPPGSTVKAGYLYAWMAREKAYPYVAPVLEDGKEALWLQSCVDMDRALVLEVVHGGADVYEWYWLESETEWQVRQLGFLEGQVPSARALMEVLFG